MHAVHCAVQYSRFWRSPSKKQEVRTKAVGSLVCVSPYRDTSAPEVRSCASTNNCYSRWVGEAERRPTTYWRNRKMRARKLPESAGRRLLLRSHHLTFSTAAPKLLYVTITTMIFSLVVILATRSTERRFVPEIEYKHSQLFD